MANLGPAPIKSPVDDDQSPTATLRKVSLAWVAWFGRVVLFINGLINGVGSVRMVATGSTPNLWVVLDENSQAIDVTGTTTNGLQEAINYARTHRRNLVVEGQGQLAGQTGNYGTIHCTTTLTLGPLWGQRTVFNQVNLVLDPVTASNAGWILDSSDFSSIEFNGQILYTGTGVGVQIAPTTDNGESFIGWTTTKLYLQTCVCIVSFANWNVDTSKGTCFAITPAGNAIVNNLITIGECNGGLYGTRVDTPTGGGQFAYNEVNLPGIHSQATTSVLVCTSAPSANAVVGNQWTANISPALNGLSTYGSSDIYNLQITGGTGAGITFGTAAANNLITCALNNANTPVVDNSTAKTNLINGGKLSTAYTLTAASQAVSGANAYTQVKYDTFDVGTASIYTPATGIFQPTLAGVYQVVAQFYVTGVASGNYVDIAVYKNGVLFREFEDLASGTVKTVSVSAPVGLNGSSDYVTFYIRSANAGAVVSNVGALSFFNAFKIS